MSKLMYALLGAGALVAVASLGSRFVVADTLSGSSSSSSSWSSSSWSSGSGPDCSGAAAGLGVIWPPDHKMVLETIVGVGYDAGLLTIMVTGIQQDELVDALGSGNTAPDGWVVGTQTAYVRAERAGPGTGRLYFISFSASGKGGTCTGMVQVFVPHDQGQGFTPIDTGQRYDSTVVPN